MLEKAESEFDEIKKAEHYNKGKYEVIEVMMDWDLDKDFLLGNAFKYIARCKYKEDEIKDIKKAIWYLNKKLEVLENE